MFSINTTTYNKAKRIPYDPQNPKKLIGYSLRSPKLSGYKSIIIHTTNGVRGSSFESEANFIANSHDISADFLIGKQGQIVQFLDPNKYTAWHAGTVRAQVYNNIFSIGIEMHNTPAEGHCTKDQLLALDWLIQKLLIDFPSIDKRYIETHRFVATPAGRKIDPSGFSDDEFYSWRNNLINSTATIITYKVINSNGVNVRQSPQVNDHNIAGTLVYNDTFISDSIKTDELGQYINGSNLWAHIYSGQSQGHSINQLGFVHMSNLRQI